MEASVQDDNLYATDLLEYLVRKGVTFSEAHEIVGRVVRYGLEEKTPLRQLSLEEWKSFSRQFEKDIFNCFDPAASVSGKKTYGSTHPAMVRKELAKWNKILK